MNIYFDMAVTAACVILLALGGTLAWFGPTALGFQTVVRRRVLVVYVARTACTLSVFALSLVGNSIFGAQAVAGPGLWRVLPDAVNYHAVGVHQMEAAARGLAFPVPDGFSAFVGLVYSNVGAHPLIVFLCNSVFDVVTLLGLLVLVRRVTGKNPPPWIVWGFGFWPSWVAWSTQLLKESALLSAGILLLVAGTSALARAEERRQWWRYGLLEWPTIGLLTVAIMLVRPAEAYVFTGSVVLLASWLLLRSLWIRTHWRTAAAGVALAVVILQAQPLRSRLYPFSADDTLRAYVNLAVEYERESNLATAEVGYAAGVTAGDPTIREWSQDRLTIVQRRQRMPEGTKEAELSPLVRPPWITRPVAVPQGDRKPVERAGTVGRIARGAARLLSSTLDTIGSYTQRLAPQNIAALRNANRQGATSFGTPAEESTMGGILLMLPSAVGHTLFAPFPWSVFTPAGLSGALRDFALVELLWVYPVVLFGLMGMVRSLRGAPPDRLLIALYVLAGIAALAIAVPNDGLLFRYRLQFLVPFAVFVPAALTSPIGQTEGSFRDEPK